MFGCGADFFGHSGAGLVLALAATAGLVFALSSLCSRPDKRRSTDREDSLEILKLRLARGDITLEEYKLLKSVL